MIDPFSDRRSTLFIDIEVSSSALFQTQNSEVETLHLQYFFNEPYPVNAQRQARSSVNQLGAE